MDFSAKLLTPTYLVAFHSHTIMVIDKNTHCPVAIICMVVPSQAGSKACIKALRNEWHAFAGCVVGELVVVQALAEVQEVKYEQATVLLVQHIGGEEDIAEVSSSLCAHTLALSPIYRAKLVHSQTDCQLLSIICNRLGCTCFPNFLVWLDHPSFCSLENALSDHTRVLN